LTIRAPEKLRVFFVIYRRKIGSVTGTAVTPVTPAMKNICFVKS